MARIHSAAALKIGQRIREARERLGISLEDFGELSQVSWTSIGRIERGAQSPNAETLVRLATALDVDPGSFLSGVTADDYGRRLHRVTARDLINARAEALDDPQESAS
ncbi:helix-turn-helix protein [Leucobacter luti]|uniref:helix-turn-helix domain-containing protein n=1 Tax=Leucobacter luti TaxID=340320 RepID=UPI00104B7BBE|nr:helix-turn-helix transcriptional regulator [Leucobacter luti]MCW2289582.1 transcriptional regulator with XRE-family HTH domain [Leucobacter luti]TCK37754.1 helix-turn-helix protein [Leucobacter luti]